MNRLLLCSIFQRYNLKAIHNEEREIKQQKGVVFNISKIQSKSNSQPMPQAGQANTGCVQYFKDTI